MQFVVPQFIDIEPKIIGPLGVRQFIILIVTGGLIFVAYKICDFSLFLIIGVFLFAAGGTLAFMKVNGRPIHYFFLNILQTAKKPKLRIWRKEFILEKELKIKEKIEIPPPPVPRKILSTAHLSDLSLLVDTGGMYREE
jgi:hypothetical protein